MLPPTPEGRGTHLDRQTIHLGLRFFTLERYPEKVPRPQHRLVDTKLRYRRCAPYAT